MVFSELYKITANEVTSVGFREGDRPCVCVGVSTVYVSFTLYVHTL